MPLRRSAPACLTSILLGVLLLCFVAHFALPGAVFNRGRGGYVHFGSSNTNSTAWYWSAHVLSRLFFAIPTGILVLVFGVHLRAGVVVALMTWTSLYVGWGSYMNIGMVPTNYNSRSGFLDWMVGRQEVNWTTDERFVREYTGMSLRGLIWTAPQGYILEQLGFGWEYSLCGSLMGYIYYLGAKSNLDNLHDADLKKSFVDSTIAVSEILWGLWIWFVLIISCISQAVHRIRIWVHKHNSYLGIEPYSTYHTILYQTLNRCFFRLLYDIFILLLTILYCCSLVFYSLVEQEDLANKGQTFFGLFTAILCLTFSLGWHWGTLYMNWKTKRESRWQKGSWHKQQQQQTPRRLHVQQPRTSPIIRNRKEIFQRSIARTNANDFDSPAMSASETEPLLSWPYSHPDRLSPPQTLQLPEGNPAQIQMGTPHAVQPTSTAAGILILWPNIETWVFLDVFVWVRRFIGLISLLCIVHNIIVATVAVVWGWESTRFMQVCN